jgi:HK97 family phage prohead protease
MTDESLAARSCSRDFVIEDMTIRSDGDGRTVEAYTAVFNRDAEIRDQDGHYNERLAEGSFTRTIDHNGTNFGVFYNHAKTIYGTPDGNLSVPVGTPIEVPVQDSRGVFTVTRYLDNPLADSVLDGIKQRAIRGYSFGGKFLQSTKTRASRGSLPTITRTEVQMREYGPTVFPSYAEAMITGTRSVSAFLSELETLEDADMARFRQMLGLATPLDPAKSQDTSTETVHVDDPALGHSARQSLFSFRAAVREKGVLR